MWKQFVKDYLTFTKKERTAVLVLLFLIAAVWLMINYLPAPTLKPASPGEIDKFRKDLASLRKGDSAQESNFHNDNKPGIKPRFTRGELFYFDPNTLSLEGWKKLGLRDKTIQTILHFTSKGGTFKQPEDIGKIYGLSAKDYERLLPYVRIQLTNKLRKDPVKDNFEKDSRTNFTPNHKTFNHLSSLEINSADTSLWIALPGIGSKLASRIVLFRQKLGGFYSADQVGETFGLPDSTFQKIKPILQCNPPHLQQININTADANALKQHPYIRWAIANAIVQYRNQHGPFKSVDDLQQIAIITPVLFQKLKYYLTTGE
jgi:competence protein ComEA